MTVRYIKYIANIFGLDKMSSDTVYSNLLCDFVISGAINYKKFSSVKVGSVQQVFGTNRFVITSGDCSFRIIKIFLSDDLQGGSTILKTAIIRLFRTWSISGPKFRLCLTESGPMIFLSPVISIFSAVM